MQITFPDEIPVFNGSTLRLEFTAVVQGQNVGCAVSVEALEDHCGAPSILEGDLLKAFAANQAKIHLVCEQALKANAGRAVILHSGYFRAYAISRHQF